MDDKTQRVRKRKTETGPVGVKSTEAAAEESVVQSVSTDNRTLLSLILSLIQTLRSHLSLPVKHQTTHLFATRYTVCLCGNKE